MDTLIKEEITLQDIEVPVVLNVGAGGVNILKNTDYDSWEKVTLDINPNDKPDLCMDVRDLDKLQSQKELYDAVVCSHVIEHFPYIDVPKVLKNMHFVLKSDGWLDIICPNILEVMKAVVDGKNDLDFPLYQVNGRDIKVIDVIYGLGNTSSKMLFENKFMEHHYGFSQKTLIHELHKAGFKMVDDYTQPGTYELRMIAYKEIPEND